MNMEPVHNLDTETPLTSSDFKNDNAVPPLDDEEEDDSNKAEWRIPTLGGLVTMTKAFRNSDFRNRQTGQLVLPTQVYIELLRDIQKAAGPARWKVFSFVFFLQLAFLLTFFCVVNLPLAVYWKIPLCLFIPLVCFFIGKTGMNWIYRVHASRMKTLIEEHREELLGYGVEVGYRHKCTSHSWNESYVWLRSILEEDATSSSLPPSPQDYPPIFLHLHVPGQIHIQELQYHPSMVMNFDTWTVIKRTHFNLTNTRIHRCMGIIFMVTICLVFLVSIFIYQAIDEFGESVAWIGYLCVLLSFFLACFTIDRLRLKSYHNVADHVNETLSKSEDGTMAGYTLKFETSTLPFQNNHMMSRRYQWVRTQGNETTMSDMEEYTSSNNLSEVV